MPIVTGLPRVNEEIISMQSWKIVILVSCPGSDYFVAYAYSRFTLMLSALMCGVKGNKHDSVDQSYEEIPRSLNAGCISTSIDAKGIEI